MAIINDNEMVNVIEVNQPGSGSIRQVRYLLSLVMFLIVTSVFIAMSLPRAFFNTPPTSNNTLIYDWNTNIFGYILFAIRCFAIFTPILGAILISKYGLYMTLLISVIVISISTIVTPWAGSVIGWEAVCLILFIHRICGGIIIPGALTFLGKWIPVNERTRLGMFIYTGRYFGMMIFYRINSFFENSSYVWAFTCYLSGYLSIISGVLWYVLGSNSPSDCKMITKQEKAHIEASLKTNDTKKRNKTPWKAIFTSKPFYALIFAHVSAFWGSDTVVMLLPVYLKFIFRMGNSGLHNYLGYINAIVLTLLISWAADYLQNNNYLSNASVRKISYAIGSWGVGFAFLLFVFIPFDYPKTIIVIYILIMGLDAIITCGYFVNHVDLSPRYAGILYAISNAISISISILAQFVKGKLLNEMMNETKWNYIYIIAPCMYLGGSILFIRFGSGERQSWDRVNLNKRESEDGEVSIELTEGNVTMNIEK